MFRLFCLGHRYKKGWFASKNFRHPDDAIYFLATVKKKPPIYEKYYYYKLVNCDDGSFTFFKVIIGDFSNAVYGYDPDFIPAEVIL